MNIQFKQLSENSFWVYFIDANDIELATFINIVNNKKEYILFPRTRHSKKEILFLSINDELNYIRKINEIYSVFINSI